MELKTYRASSMADALAEVKKDLGKDAVILHARTFKAGGVMGVGARTIVEITASNDQRAPGPRPRATKPAPGLSPVAAAIPAVARAYASTSGQTQVSPSPPPAAAPPSDFEPFVARRADAVTAEPARVRGPVSRIPEPARVPASPSGLQSAPAHGDSGSLGTRVRVSPVDAAARRTLEDELSSIKALVTQVLDVTRGHGADPRSAQAVAGPWRGVVQALERHGGSRRLIDDVLAGAVRRAGESPGPRAAMDGARNELASLIPITRAPTPGPRQSGRPSIIALIGPTGVGKTTTIAKLAADYALRSGLRVGLIAADTYRIAAVEQLRTYAAIIDVPVVVSGAPDQIVGAIAELASCDVVLLDTAGRSQRDAERLDELARTLDAATPDRVHLVLSATVSEPVATEAAARFGALHPHSLIFTKLDEAVLLGPVVNIPRTAGCGLAFLTTGQDVPDNIEHANGDRLASLILSQGVEVAG